MNNLSKSLLLGATVLVLLIAVFSAGCTIFGGDGGSATLANAPTDTTTKMSMSLTANQWTNRLGTYPTTTIGTVTGSPAQLSVSLSNGYKIIASPAKLVVTGGGKTITTDMATKNAEIKSGSKTLTITPHDGATSVENGKTTTYKESGTPSWENLRISLSDAGGTVYYVASNPDITGSYHAQENGFKLTGPNSLRVGLSNVQMDSHVFVDVNKNTATVKVQYYDSGYRKHTQTMSLTWNNGKWHLYKAVEDPNTIDKEELSG